MSGSTMVLVLAGTSLGISTISGRTPGGVLQGCARFASLEQYARLARGGATRCDVSFMLVDVPGTPVRLDVYMSGR